jgi:hypothetical protein
MGLQLISQQQARQQAQDSVRTALAALAARSAAAATAGSSNSGSSSSGGRVVDAAQALHINARFPVRSFDYDARMRLRTKLIHILDSPPGQPAHVMLHLHGSNRRPIPVSNAAVDNGCNECTVTQAFADANGITWERRPMPLLMQSDGESRPAFIGCTEPLTIIVGEYGCKPLVINKPEGVAVIVGGAAGMYNLSLDTESVKERFGHVNPLFEHFLWYPDAPEDVSVVCGVPVSTTYPATTFLPAVTSRLSTAGQVQSPTPSVAAVAQVLPSSAGSSSGSKQQHTPAAVQQPQQAATQGDAAARCSGCPTTQPAPTQQQRAAAASAAAVAAGQLPSRPAKPFNWRPIISLVPWLLLQLFIACWLYFIDLPLGGLPSWTLQQLVSTANQPVQCAYRRLVSARRYHPAQQPSQTPTPPAAQQQEASSRKRRQGDPMQRRCLRFSRKLLWRQVGGTAPAGARFHPSRLLARACLMLLLIAACCVATASAMQASSSWQLSTGLSTGAAALGLQPGMQQQAAQQAVRLLGHELGAFQRCSFRCYSPVPWL